MPDLRARGPAAEHGQPVRPDRRAAGAAGQEMTYTVRAQGRLQTAEEFGDIVVRSNPDGSVVRLKDVARIELGALNYQQIGRVNGQPGCAHRRLPGARARTRSRSPTASSRRWTSCSTRFPPDLDYALLARHDAAGVRGHPRDPDHARRGDGARHPRRLPVPAELARDAHPDDRGAGVAHRHVRRLPAARLLDQHAVAVRPGARDRPRRRRRDRRRRGGGASHRGGDDAARRDAEGDGGGVGAGRQHRADPRRRCSSRSASWAASRAG